MVNRVKIEIMGSNYTIASPESESYVTGLAEEVNKSVKELMEQDSRLTLTAALVLTSLNLADSLKKEQQNGDNIRRQLTEYMNSSPKSLDELSYLRKENERLKKRLEGK